MKQAFRWISGTCYLLALGLTIMSARLNGEWETYSVIAIVLGVIGVILTAIDTAE